MSKEYVYLEAPGYILINIFMAQSNQNNDINKLLAENTERLKELACINETTKIIKEGKSVEESLQKIALRLLILLLLFHEHRTQLVSRLPFHFSV